MVFRGYGFPHYYDTPMLSYYYASNFTTLLQGRTTTIVWRGGGLFISTVSIGVSPLCCAALIRMLSPLVCGVCVAVSCIVLQRFSVCCCALQCVSVCSCVLLRVAMWGIDTATIVFGVRERVCEFVSLSVLVDLCVCA